MSVFQPTFKRTWREWPLVGGTPGPIVINDPTDLPNLVLWLDGADASTLWQNYGTLPASGSTPVTGDGQLVAQWDDKSGNNNHHQGLATLNRPTYKTNIQNGLSTVRSIDASVDDFMENPNSPLSQDTEVTFFWTAACSNPALAVATIWCNSDTLAPRIETRADKRTVGGGLVGFKYDGTTSVNSKNLQVLDSAFHQFALRISGDAVQGWVDGVEQTPGSGAAALGATSNDISRIFQNIASGGQFFGDLGELVITDGAQTDEYLAAFNTWQKTKWATP